MQNQLYFQNILLIFNFSLKWKYDGSIWRKINGREIGEKHKVIGLQVVQQLFSSITLMLQRYLLTSCENKYHLQRERWCELKESSSCWWSLCENDSVTETACYPATLLQNSPRCGVRGSNWKVRPNCSKTSLISFMYTPTDRLLMHEWIAEMNQMNQPHVYTLFLLHREITVLFPH